jgi:hypothetical protein
LLRYAENDSNARRDLYFYVRSDETTVRASALVMEHSPLQGFSMRGFHAKLEGEEGEGRFWFEGGSDADRRVRVEIQGVWLHSLPWDRAVQSKEL